MPAAHPLASKYEGGPLDLASQHGSSLFCDGGLALTSKFMGKVNALQLFLADLKTRAEMCHWDHPTHGILTVAVNGTNYSLLEDYGKITDLQVKAAWMACNATDASPRAKQNSQMMYNILNIIDSQGNTRSFLYNYRQLTTEEVRTKSRN